MGLEGFAMREAKSVGPLSASGGSISGL